MCARHLDVLTRHLRAGERQALVEEAREIGRRALQLRLAPERRDLGNDRGEVVHGARDLLRELRAFGVLRADQALLEMPRVQAQARERILHLVRDLRRHPAEGRERATAQPLELVRGANRHGRLRREQRQQLEIVLRRFDARRRLDHERARRPTLDDERRRRDHAPFVAGAVAPITSRYLAIAPSPCSTCTTTGPEVKNSTSSPKNGLALCTA